jgi:hypothetical protein
MKQSGNYFKKIEKPQVPANPARFERICRYSQTLSIPLADAARLVDRMGM